MRIVWKFRSGLADARSTPRELPYGGLLRTYLLHVPPTLPVGGPVSLVLALHGTGGTARGMEAVTGLSVLSDRHGFIVAYPEGVGRVWNDGRGGGGTGDCGGEVDDVGFISALVAELRGLYGVDPGRVYATGISSGAFFCHFLAVRRADLVAAIAPVVGGLSPDVAAAFCPSRPVSVLAIQGTGDPLVPFGGGSVRWYRGGVLPAEETVRRWAEHNGCRREPRRQGVQDLGPSGGMRIWRIVYEGGREATEVSLVVIEGGGHTWPGGLPFLPERIVGRICRDLDASALLWDFFAGHPRPG